MIKLVKRFVRFILDYFRIKKITKVHQDNQEFLIVTRDKLGEEWNLINNFDYSEFQIFNNINSDKINKVFYFGAHQSVIPIKIHKIFLKKANFFCFEVIKKNFLISKENIALNDCRDKVKIFNEAISTINGYDYFDPISLNSYKTKKNFLSKKVKSSDLETILKKYGKGELLYFDIEGLEGSVLEKSIKFLKTWKNNIFIEAHGLAYTERYNYSNKKLYRLLVDNGYEFFKMKDDFHESEEKFFKVVNSNQIPETRFYCYAHN